MADSYEKLGSKNIDERVSVVLKVKQAGSLSTVEQVLTAAYPQQAFIMHNARLNADKFTKKLYNQEGNGTDGANAFKHIYWSAFATNMMGEKYTRLFTNAHEIKYEYLGKKAKASHFDLYSDKNTGQVYIVEKSTKKVVEATYYYIK